MSDVMKYFFTIFVSVFISLTACTAYAGDKGVLRLHDHSFNTDQTWSGVVEIDGVVQFSAEAKLTILPGTVVRFVRTDSDGDGIGENEIYVQGVLHAVGTTAEPIVFTSAEENPAPGDWGAVNLMASENDKNRFENCVVEYAYRGFHMHFSRATVKKCTLRDNYLALQCQDSTMDVSGCVIERNRGAIVFKDSKLTIKDNIIRDNYWAIRFLYGEAEIEGNIITDNLINGVTFRENKARLKGNTISRNRKGVSSESSEVNIYGNNIDNSSESGVYLRGSKGYVKFNEVTLNGNAGISIEDSDVTIKQNNITDNRNYGIDNNGSMTVKAGTNWWGTTDTAKIAGMVFDNSDDPEVGKVETEPVAASRIENVP